MNQSTPADKEFIERLTHILEAHIGEENFGVSELAGELNMSRSNLYFKVKSVSGKSVSRFIRELRLQKGMELLSEGTKTVSEVAYEVGFNSSTYFITCFRNYFGYPPGEVKDMASSVRKIPLTEMPKTVVEKETETPGPKKLVSNKTFFWIVAVFIVVVSALYFVIRPVATEPFATDDSLAILPFRNLSDDPENQHFADGVLESILESLKTSSIKVVSRTTVESYRNNSTKSIKQIAVELGVSYILEGSVQRNGNRVLVTAQLYEPGKQENRVWAKQFEENIGDVFEVQNDISQQIALSLRMEIYVGYKNWQKIPTHSIEAWDFWGRANNHKRETKSDYEQMIELCREAIAIDPAFDRPYSKIGYCYFKLRDFGVGIEIWQDSALKYINKAIALNPSNSSNFRYRSEVYKNTGNEEKAIQDLLKGLKNDPNDFIIMRALGKFYSTRAEFGKAMDFFLKGLALENPVGDDEYYEKLAKVFEDIDQKQAYKYFRKQMESGNPSNYSASQLFNLEFRNRKFERAFGQAHKMNELSPQKFSSYLALGYGSLKLDEYAYADQQFNKVRELQAKSKAFDEAEHWYYLHHGWVKIQAGKEAEGKAMIDEFKAQLAGNIEKYGETKKNSWAFLSWAMLQAYEGNKEKSVQALEKWYSLEENIFSPDISKFIFSDPFLDLVRDEKRFKAIEKDILDREAANRKLIRQKLKEYHKRGELRWLRLGW